MTKAAIPKETTEVNSDARRNEPFMVGVRVAARATTSALVAISASVAPPALSLALSAVASAPIWA